MDNASGQFTMRQPDDFHVHFRRGPLMRRVMPFTAEYFGRGVLMPNTDPPILNSELALQYEAEVLEAMGELCDGSHFEPLIAIQVRDDTTVEVVKRACKHDFITTFKVYPKGVTNNSHDGVSDLRAIYPVCEVLQFEGKVLSIHGQMPNKPVLRREALYLPGIRELSKLFPRLKIVVEHISTREAVAAVDDMSEMVAATITPHHLLLTLDDVLAHVVEENGKRREGICVHHHCQPTLQEGVHREQLIRAAVYGHISGKPKYFLGSDTAPHVRGRKECDCGCPGIFSAPVIMPVLVKVFKEALGDDFLPALQRFTSESGALFYGLPLNEKQMVIAEEAWTVPKSYFDGDFEVVPLLAGKQLDHKVLV